MLWTLVSWACVVIVSIEVLAVLVIMFAVVTSGINDPQRRGHAHWHDELDD